MMLTPIYLTFATEAEALAALYDGDSPRYSGLEILNRARCRCAPPRARLMPRGSR